MRSTILIWGAGAIGGTIGAYLVRGGHECVFVDTDANHVAAINASGLSVEGPIDSFNIFAKAHLPPGVEGNFERVLLCVKAHHTRQAVQQLAPHLAPTGFVASLQNGLNELVISEMVSRRRTIGAFLNFGADYQAPGRIHFGGRGAVVIGEIDGSITPRIVELQRLLQVFDARTEVTDNIMGYLWGKLGYGALLFATAVTNASICEALAAPGPRSLYRRIAAEAVAVAQALTVTPLGFNGYNPEAFKSGASLSAVDESFTEMVSHNLKSAKTHSGIWRDLALRKRPTEVDAQLGPIVRFGKERGIATPTTEHLIAMIHEIEDGKRPLAWENLDELGRLA